MTARQPLTRVLALLAALALAAAACGDGDDGEEAGGGTTSTTAGGSAAQPGASVDGVLKLGALLPQTGNLAQFGPAMQAAVQLAVDDINAAGGVLGQDVVLVSADSGTDADIANTAAERFLSAENVDGIIGAAASGVTLLGVIGPTVGARRVECSGSTTSPLFNDFEDDGLFFRTAPTDFFQSELLADSITADGFSSVAIANRADDYGQALADATAAELEDAGAEVVTQVAFDPDGSNFDADVARLASANPDAVVLIAFPEEGAQVLNAMVEQGVGPADLPIYVTDGLASDDLAASVDPNDLAVLNGMKGSRPSTEVPGDFGARLTTAAGTGTLTFGPQFYDCTVIVALGAVAAGSDDPELIADQINDVTRQGTACSTFEECKGLLDDGEDIDYEGVTSFDFDDSGEPERGVYDLYEFVDGKLTVTDTVTLEKEGGQR
ncbi:MAG: ABC transporter substrate-binding protein [Acidimicrobiales bacterium]